MTGTSLMSLPLETHFISCLLVLVGAGFVCLLGPCTVVISQRMVAATSINTNGCLSRRLQSTVCCRFTTLVTQQVGDNLLARVQLL